MTCKISKYAWMLPKKASPLTQKQLDMFRDMTPERKSNYVGFRAWLDASDNQALNNVGAIKKEKMAQQSMKGWKLGRQQYEIARNAELLARDIQDANGISAEDVGMSLLMNRVRGDVFNAAEKEIVAKTFLNRMNGLQFLSDSIERAIERGDDAALQLLSIEMNKTSAAIAAYLGDINATSVAFKHIAKLNTDIAKGRKLAKLFPDGGC